MSSAPIPYGKLFSDGDGKQHLYLTEEKIEAYARTTGLNLVVTGKMCDFCHAELPVSHETQTCRRNGCNTMYDTCEACTEIRKANKKYDYCFLDPDVKLEGSIDHMREKVKYVVYGASYDDRWDRGEQRARKSSDKEYPPIKMTKEMFKGYMHRVQSLWDLVDLHEIELTLERGSDGIGTLLHITGPKEADDVCRQIADAVLNKPNGE